MKMTGEETHNIEYKQKWNDDCLKAISAMANANGGRLLLVSTTREIRLN